VEGLSALAEGDGKSLDGKARDGSIRQEMMTFRAHMNYAADSSTSGSGRCPRGKLILDKARREEFTPVEYRQLHTFARKWIRRRPGVQTLVSNSGVQLHARDGEHRHADDGGRNLRWRDIDVRRTNTSACSSA